MTHHEDDVRSMREAIVAILERRFGHVCKAGIEWLDTDEGKNDPRLLDLWDAYESDEAYDEWAARNPTEAMTYLREARETYPHEDESRARASYLYGFDLYDDVLTDIRRGLDN